MNPRKANVESAMANKKTPKHQTAKDDEKWPTAFELTQIATALCQLRKDEQPSIYPDPGNHFPEAGRLLLSARDYVEAVRTDPHKREAERMVAIGWGTPMHYHELNLPIPFDALLRPSGKKKAGKKHRTYVASIGTRNGLEKAIRRHFQELESSRIISCQSMTWGEYQHLVKAQKEAIARRAAKRVKEKAI